ncbi:MAG: hypothetical protein Q9226_008824, partial [Calogaya cf. arnoldii]
MAVVDEATPGLPPSLRERQSKPVQEVVGNKLLEPLPPGAVGATTGSGGMVRGVEVEVDKVGVAARPLPPRPKDRQRSPVQGAVVAAAEVLVDPAAGDKIELDTEAWEIAVLPALSEKQTGSVQEVIDPTLTGIPPLLLLE